MLYFFPLNTPEPMLPKHAFCTQHGLVIKKKNIKKSTVTQKRTLSLVTEMLGKCNSRKTKVAQWPKLTARGATILRFTSCFV
jgi:hypothetical protein